MDTIKPDTIFEAFRRAGLLNPHGGRIAGRLFDKYSTDDFLLFMGMHPIPDPHPAPPPDEEQPTGTIQPFAAVHHYRRCTDLLQDITRRLRVAAGLPKRAFRIFSNSRLPERSLAAALNMGTVGRSALLMNPDFGTSFILAGMLVNTAYLEIEPEHIAALPRITSLCPPENRYTGCGTCRACIQACPAGAIHENGKIRPEQVPSVPVHNPGSSA